MTSDPQSPDLDDDDIADMGSDDDLVGEPDIEGGDEDLDDLDDDELGDDDAEDEDRDDALEDTFPASDPLPPPGVTGR